MDWELVVKLLSIGVAVGGFAGFLGSSWHWGFRFFLFTAALVGSGAALFLIAKDHNQGVFVTNRLTELVSINNSQGSELAKAVQDREKVAIKLNEAERQRDTIKRQLVEAQNARHKLSEQNERLLTKNAELQALIDRKFGASQRELRRQLAIQARKQRKEADERARCAPVRSGNGIFYPCGVQ